MKTIRNMYDKKLTYENLMKAHKKCRKGKSSRKDVILFNLKQEEYILWLYEKLKSGEYRHSGYSVFYVYEPKLRKIEKSKYIDRIVHRWVVDEFLYEYFVRGYIYHSYACIKGKGTHRAVLAVQKAMKHCDRIWDNWYILKMDIRKFFDNIDKGVLVEILRRKIQDKKLMKLIVEIVYSNGQDKGIAIGNFTSQIFANVYMHECDRYIKEELRVKWYYRYMDDSILFCKTKEEAKELLVKIRSFLLERLKLELNAKTQIFKGKQGVNFCGYKINGYRIKLRDRGKRNLKKKIKRLKKEIKEGKISSCESAKYLSGHMGYIQIANKYNLVNKYFFNEL